MIAFLAFIFIFSTLPYIAASEFHNVLDYGAVADGITDDTHAFEKAWEQTCKSSNNLPVMHIPSDKTFLVQPLSFHGPCNSKNIEVEINGRIVAPKEPSDWECGDNVCNKWISFHNLDGVSVHGSGILDGHGEKWWSMLDHRRPSAMEFSDSSNVLLSGLSFKNNPHIHIVLRSSTSVQISDITIDSPEDSPNTDGINIGQSTNISISNSKIGTGDDCISIVEGSSHINIRDITCGPGHGISIGSLGKEGEYDTVEYVHVSDVVFKRTMNGARIKTWQGGRGYARHIVFERITSIEANNPIIIDQFYIDHHSDNKPRNGKGQAVHVRNITYRYVSGTSMHETGVKLACSAEVPCKDIIMEDIHIAMRHGGDALAYCENVHGRAHGEITPRVSCLDYEKYSEPSDHGSSEVHNILDYGAVADGRADDSDAFKKAWDSTCKSSNSPVLYIPYDRTFLVQPLKFEGPCSSKNIRIQINGNIVAPRKPSEWKCEHDFCNTWINFDSVDGVWLNGSGTIGGQGKKWWSMRDRPKPCALHFRDSSNVRITGLSFKNNPRNHIFFHQSRSVQISDILIDSNKNSPNTDGINIGQCTNVSIENSKIGTGDDCISIIGGSSHINIRNITCGPGHGISIGSLGKDGEYDTVEYVHVHDVVFTRTTNGARIKTWQGGSGYARHIVFERITTQNADYPIIIDQFYTDDKSKQHKGQSSAVRVSNVTYRDISGTSRRETAVKLACSDEIPCSDIFMENININWRHRGRSSAYCDNVDGSARGEITPHIRCLDYE